MMSVCLVVSDAESGGVERVFGNLARGLSELNVRVLVALVGRRVRGLDQSDLFSLAEIVDLRYDSTGQGFRGWLSYARQLWQLSRVIRRYAVEGVVSAKERANFLAMFAAALSGATPTRIVTRHVPLKGGLTGDARWFTPRLYTLWSLMGAKMVAVSRQIADEIRQYSIPTADVRFLPNPVLQTVGGANLREWERGLVVAAGRLCFQKGFDVLVRAVASEKFPKDARVVIYGSGELEDELRLLARDLGVGDRVEFAGYVNDLACRISRANVFVLSSRWEGMPTVLIEAAAAGAAIVATDCPSGPRELLSDWEGAELVPVGAPEELAAGVARSISRWGNKRPSAPRVLSDYTTSAAATAYLELLRAGY